MSDRFEVNNPGFPGNSKSKDSSPAGVLAFSEEIPMPSRDEINRSVNMILDQGLPEKPRVSWKMLSLRDVLFGVEDCTTIALSVYLVTMVAFAVLSYKGAPFIPLQFLSAPMLFGGLLYLSMWKDIMNRTVEWKQVCRVDYRYLTVCRMLLFGAVSVVMSVPGNLLLWQVTGRSIDLLWIISFSFASLFLYGLVAVLILTRSVRFGTVIPTLLWICLSVAMFAAGDLMRLTMMIPISALLVIAGFCAVGLIFLMKQYLTTPLKGEMFYAYN